MGCREGHRGLKAIFPLTLSGEDKTSVCVRERKKPIREKGVKYIIYLHWQRETNALTEIEDTLPSLIDTQTHTHTGAFWLKDWIEN